MVFHPYHPRSYVEWRSTTRKHSCSKSMVTFLLYFYNIFLFLKIYFFCSAIISYIFVWHSMTPEYPKRFFTSHAPFFTFSARPFQTFHQSFHSCHGKFCRDFFVLYWGQQHIEIRKDGYICYTLRIFTNLIWQAKRSTLCWKASIFRLQKGNSWQWWDRPAQERALF